MNEDQHQGSISDLWRALSEEPENGTFHLLASQAAIALGDFGAASILLRHGMTLSSPEQWGDPFSGQWVDLRASPRYLNQIGTLRAFLAERPGATYARFLLAYHWAYTGRMGQAVQELERVLEIDQRDVQAWELLRITESRLEFIPAPLD
ncbi:MAG: hypothetical protein EA424_21575 [Planctomycetaceae bacterium]|nr:MAG: hypothetical protein EA424_21575 [Planctomycetaceae bacterium]